jgi:hypothetical protein
MSRNGSRRRGMLVLLVAPVMVLLASCSSDKKDTPSTDAPKASAGSVAGTDAPESSESEVTEAP